jgi:hypothetical protein
MKNNHSYIIELCQTLSSENKQPSLALIRNRSTRPLPIPEVIKVLQGWKKDPNKFAEPEEREERETNDIDETQKSLVQRVELLELQVMDLSQQLQKLLDKS